MATLTYSIRCVNTHGDLQCCGLGEHKSWLNRPAVRREYILLINCSQWVSRGGRRAAKPGSAQTEMRLWRRVNPTVCLPSAPFDARSSDYDDAGSYLFHGFMVIVQTDNAHKPRIAWKPGDVGDYSPIEEVIPFTFLHGFPSQKTGNAEVEMIPNIFAQ